MNGAARDEDRCRDRAEHAEEGLTEQREFSLCLLECVADGVVACDADGTLTLFNRTAREWHGMDPRRLPPEEWARHYDLFRADGVTPLPTEEIPLTRAFRGEVVRDVGMAIVAAGQPPRFLVANGSVITDSAGQKLGAVVVMRDVTAFRRLEQELHHANEDLERRVAQRTAELRASERRLTEAQRTAHIGSWERDLVANRIFLSDEALRIFGLPARQYGFDLAQWHEHWLRLIHPEDRDRASRAYAEALGGGPRYDLEYRVVRPGGEERFVHSIAVVERDGSGRPCSVFGTMQDVTERKKAEQALQRLNRELRAVSSCNQILMKAEDEQTLLHDVCRIICDEAGYRMAWVGYAEPDPETIRPVAWAGFDSDDVATARLSWSEDLERGPGPAGMAVRSGEPVHIQDFATDPRMAPWRDAALARGYRSGVALPLRGEDGWVFGVLLIYSAEPQAVTAEEFKLLEELAGDLAFGITVLRTRAGLKRAESVAQARLRMLETAYASGRTLHDALREMLDEIEAQTGSRIGFYHFVEKDQQTLSLQNWSTNTLANLCTAEAKGNHYPVAEAGVWADCVREGRPVIHNDYASLSHRRGMPAGHAPVVRELVVPIRRGDRIVAIVGVGNKPVDYNETDVQIALLLGDFSWEIVIRRQAEESLRQGKARLNEAQRIAHLGNWELDLATNALLWSDEVYRIFEIDREQFGASYDAFLGAVHPEDRESVNRAYAQSVTDRTPYSIVHRLLMKDGRVKYVEERCETFYAEDGRPLRSAGTVHDVTDRRQTEQELLRLNAELDGRVKERTAELEAKNRELERMNKLFVGRELRMIELKEKIRELEAGKDGQDAES